EIMEERTLLASGLTLAPNLPPALAPVPTLAQVQPVKPLNPVGSDLESMSEDDAADVGDMVAADTLVSASEDGAENQLLLSALDSTPEGSASFADEDGPASAMEATRASNGGEQPPDINDLDAEPLPIGGTFAQKVAQPLNV